ncbi:hypothetical protein PJF56_01140 [Roseofilum sp. BLCC_M91]|uniref:Uncharacterized protein n=1 Tax=Roseofilum halophilum BLCC-M91 TaxID=3022259 RepID=A0ABT7BGQ5_9CYAN|nr:hypothetical protein [Roseofilum halophilum]MDJ1177458.1 hypothetical protein [Roseofilum halophilum BLCC-M91]
MGFPEWWIDGEIDGVGDRLRGDRADERGDLLMKKCFSPLFPE